MPASAKQKAENPADAARHCLSDIPYRMLVLKGVNQHGVPLYFVAGSASPPQGAEKALREAHKIHGSNCFYCRKPTVEITIDHAEPAALGGTDTLQNLLIACKPCNARKNHKPIEAFSPAAGREWLNALLRQVQERLDRLDGKGA